VVIVVVGGFQLSFQRGFGIAVLESSIISIIIYKCSILTLTCHTVTSVFLLPSLVFGNRGRCGN
jgi:hypothetical protein